MTTETPDRAALIETERGRISPGSTPETPVQALEAIVTTLNSTPEPNFDLILEVGSGPLETLLRQGHEEMLWPRIERLARDDPRFRRALSVAWAYDSPMLARRDALLSELGEHRAVTLRFVAEPNSFEDADGFAWRALEVSGVPEGAGLAQTLRAIADVIEGSAAGK